MPYDSLSLVAVMDLAEDLYKKGQVPATSGGGAESHGVTDEQIWKAAVGGENPLFDMDFATACAVDPRRIDGLIMQHMTKAYKEICDQAFETQNWDGNDQLRADLQSRGESLNYITAMGRYHDMRAEGDGEVTAKTIADSTEVLWTTNTSILATSLQMFRPNQKTSAQNMWEAISDEWEDAQRAIRAALDICQRAVGLAPDRESTEAWQRMAAILTNVRSTLEESISTAAEQTGERMGGLGTTWLEDRQLSGHRAPGPGLGQWRRSGGRFYAGL